MVYRTKEELMQALGANLRASRLAENITHQLSVNGKFSHITDDDLLTVADRFAIGTAKKVQDQVKEAIK